MKQYEYEENDSRPHVDNRPQTQAQPMPVEQAASLYNEGRAPQEPSQQSAAPLLDEQGGFAPEWYSRFDELKDYAPSLAKFRRPEALAKSYAKLERMKGYPGPEDEKRMSAFRAAMGLPPKAEEYAFARPEEVPAEMWDDKMAGKMARVAHKLGIPTAAMDSLCKEYWAENAHLMEHRKQHVEAEVEAAREQLQEEWGWAYEANLETIATTLEHLGERAGVDVSALAQSEGLRANTDFAKLMLAVSNMVSESPLRGGEPTDRKAEAKRIATDPTHPLHEAYMRSSHPQHRYANEQYDKLAFGRKK